MHISTQSPTVTTTLSAFGDLIVLVIETGPETIRVALTPNHAMHAAALLQREASGAVNIRNREAEIVSLAAERRKRA